DRAVVLEVVEEAAGRIDRARMVERHGVGDVPAQEGGRTEIGQRREGEDGAHACGTHACRTQAWDAMKAWTSLVVGSEANEPCRVTASAPAAAAWRSVACRRGSVATRLSSPAAPISC